MTNEKIRCEWTGNDPKMIEYHDTLWGVPVHDDQTLFAKLSLDLMQAGLSWRTILYKRENFERAFDNFHIETVSKYDEAKYEQLLADPGIVRNRLKIRAIINNAARIMEIQQEFGSFSNYIWNFTDNRVINNAVKSLSDIPAKTELSDKISRDLLKRGFKFVGTTIIYAWLQAVGVVNDHTTDCFRYTEVNQ
ncbi:MAG: DNA-3-methyladenine glycosylase I [Firmicutes bacterium]|nr:DNA-3-methyladenine glycosylase I [Bacillota bacterium]